MDNGILKQEKQNTQIMQSNWRKHRSIKQ